jgi:hypothetical protein
MRQTNALFVPDLLAGCVGDVEDNVSDGWLLGAAAGLSFRFAFGR